MRRLGSFLPGEGVGGSAIHWSGGTWRWTDMEFKIRSHYEERYGKNFIPADMTTAPPPGVNRRCPKPEQPRRLPANR